MGLLKNIKKLLKRMRKHSTYTRYDALKDAFPKFDGYVER